LSHFINIVTGINLDPVMALSDDKDANLD